MLKNILICTLSILSFVTLQANEKDESVIIGHYNITENITPGAFACDKDEINCIPASSLACKDCDK